MLTISASRRTSQIVSLAALAVAAVALTGCASPQADAAGDPETVGAPEDAGDITFDLSADAVSSIGPTGYPGTTFPIPEGARSVTVAFECEGNEFFSVELGDSMMLGQGMLRGLCEGTTEFSWPLTAQTQSTLAVLVADGVAWTATPSFSADEFLHDEALRADCSAYAAVYSAFVNADSGVTFFGAIDEAEWDSRVASATSQLAELAASAESDVSAEITELYDIVAASTPTVGESLNGTDAQIQTIAQACDANHTPVIILGEFGG